MIKRYRDVNIECEEFTKAMLLKYSTFEESRIAKRKINKVPFFGQILSVKYAPEWESIQETREKLEQRRSEVMQRLQSKCFVRSFKFVYNSSFLLYNSYCYSYLNKLELQRQRRKKEEVQPKTSEENKQDQPVIKSKASSHTPRYPSMKPDWTYEARERTRPRKRLNIDLKPDSKKEIKRRNFTLKK